MNDLTVYAVEFFTTDDATTRRTKVVLEDGYSDFTDIPNIIACRHYGTTGKGSKIVILKLALKQD